MGAALVAASASNLAAGGEGAGSRTGNADGAAGVAMQSLFAVSGASAATAAPSHLSPEMSISGESMSSRLRICLSVSI